MNQGYAFMGFGLGTWRVDERVHGTSKGPWINHHVRVKNPENVMGGFTVRTDQIVNFRVNTDDLFAYDTRNEYEKEIEDEVGYASPKTISALTWGYLAMSSLTTASA